MGVRIKNELVILEQASFALSNASSFEELKQVRDAAEAARVFAKAAKIGLEVQNRAAVIRLRAERRAGSFLRRLKLRGGDRRSKGRNSSLKLSDLGISKSQSKRWQLEASVPEEVFEKYVESASTLCEELTAAGLLRLADRLKSERAASDTARTHGPVSRRRARSCSPILQSPATEMVTEAQNHRELLWTILAPICDTDSPSRLCSSERRAVKYLLGEIDSLLRRLEESLRQEGSDITCNSLD